MSKRGENIYKRKDGRWEARYIKRRKPDGTACYGYCYGTTYRDAKEKLRLAVISLANGDTASTDAPRKFSSFCDEWLKLKRSRVKESTFIKYSAVIEKHIKPHLGEYRAENITAVTAEEFSHRLLSDEGLSAKTVRDILTLLHAVIKYSSKSVPSLRSLELIYPRAEKKEMRVLSREEQRRFTEYLMHDTDCCKFGTLLCLMTGMRIGEICALRWSDISLEDGTVRVDKTMQRLKCADGATRVVVSEPKSTSSARVIPLGSLAVELCRRFRADGEAYVLTGEVTRYIEPRCLQYKMERYVAECRLDGVHFHTLRHSFATRCIEVGFDIKSLSEVLGHANVQITLDRYVHSSMELKRENMKKLSELGY